MEFSELVNKRLDYLQAYCTLSHYRDNRGMAKRWIREWDKLKCGEISTDMVQDFLIKRSKMSPNASNKDLVALRTLFNYGVQKKWCSNNPTDGIPFFPVEKKFKYVPPKEHVLKVISTANPKDQAYLWTFKETMGRMSEINRMTWDDVNLPEKYVVLYTRKKKDRGLTPRKVPMTEKLFEVLSDLNRNRRRNIPWVFWHKYWDKKKKKNVIGPYQSRSKIMKTLCTSAGVKYFRYHAFRHFGASTLDNANVNIGAIQRILGHESRSTTEIYLHSIGDAEREAMKIFEQVTKNPHTNPHTLSELETEKESASIG